MYPFFLALHNILRWVVVILAIYALVRIYMGLFRRSEFTETDRKAMSYYNIGMDIQLLLGLALYFFLSPITMSAMQNFGAAMRDSDLRFFAVEHITMMIVAVVLAHVASIMTKRAADARGKFRRAAIWETLSVIVLVVAIPWWRPLAPMIASLITWIV